MSTLHAWLKQFDGKNTPSDQEPVKQNDLLFLLEHVLNQNRAWIYAHSDYRISPEQLNQLEKNVNALKSGQPMAYIIGQQKFWDLNFKVNSHTLIPRPDTETLIEAVIELLEGTPPKHILDLGTGSGVLAIVLAHIYPKADVQASDKSAEALKVAKYNANFNYIKNIQFQQSDWFDAIIPNQYDLIISNPPYIAENDTHLNALKHEPIGALVADQNGLGDYIRITNTAKDFLTKDGLLIFEHGWQQQKAVQTIMLEAGFKNIGSRKDLAGHERVTFGFK